MQTLTLKCLKCNTTLKVNNKNEKNPATIVCPKCHAVLRIKYGMKNATK